MKKQNTEKLLKVFKVNFADFSKGQDNLNVSSLNVLAETAEYAIEVAKERLTNPNAKTHYVESVELLCCID